jgi:hypothetical protein
MDTSKEEVENKFDLKLKISWMYFKSWIRLAGMHITRPVGQMWPAETFHLEREAQNIEYFACLFNKNFICMCRNVQVLALEIFFAYHRTWVVHPCKFLTLVPCKESWRSMEAIHIKFFFCFLTRHGLAGNFMDPQSKTRLRTIRLL